MRDSSLDAGIRSRLVQLLDRGQGKTQAALARHCGVSTAAVAQWVKNGGISLENLIKVAEFFEVSAEWLQSGEEGQITRSAPYDIAAIRRANLQTLIERDGGNQAAFARKIGKSPQQSHSMLKGHKAFGSAVAREIERKLQLSLGSLDHENAYPPTGWVSVPEACVRHDPQADQSCLPEITTIGNPALYPEAFFSALGVCPSKCVRIRVFSDSMAPSICKHDMAMVAQMDSAPPSNIPICDGDIYALFIDSDFCIKRLARIKNGIRVFSDNPTYPTEDYLDADAARLNIVGRIVEIQRVIL